MHQLKRIVVGHDLGRGGETALISAARLAKRFGAALRLVHVIEPLHSYQRIAHPLTTPEAIEALAQKTGAKLQALAASRDLSPLNVEYEVRRGKPFVEIIIARRAWQADLIVVGPTSRDEERLIGSTSARVLRKALVPVLIAKKGLRADPKTLLVPTDFSPCAKKAAEESLVLAKTFSARVVFLHVLDLFPAYAVSYADDVGVSVPLPPPAPEELDREWQAFLSGMALENVDWTTIAEEGEPAMEILHQAERHRADLIVMGTHGRSGLDYMLMGSVAERVARRARDPVLTIRPDAFQFEMP